MPLGDSGAQQEQCRNLSPRLLARAQKGQTYATHKQSKIPSLSCRTPGAVPSQPKYTAGGEKPPSSCHHSNNPDIPSPVVLPVNHKILQQHFPFFFFYNKKAQTCTLVFLPVTYNEDFLSLTKTKGQD